MSVLYLYIRYPGVGHNTDTPWTNLSPCPLLSTMSPDQEGNHGTGCLFRSRVAECRGTATAALKPERADACALISVTVDIDEFCTATDDVILAVHTLHTLAASSQLRAMASDNRSAATTVQPLRASGWPA